MLPLSFRNGIPRLSLGMTVIRERERPFAPPFTNQQSQRRLPAPA
jgi:hypothetical protein